MKLTKTDNQDLILKNKIELFFKNSMANRKNTGVCVVKDIMSVVTDKWSLFVIYNLGYFQTLRFNELKKNINCLLYTSPSPRDQRGSRMPSSA